MLIKTLLIAIFILLSWNSFHLSSTNDYLKVQVKRLAENDATNAKQLTENKTLVQNLLKSQAENQDASELLTIKTSLDKQSKILTDHNKNVLKNAKSLTEQKKTLTEQKKQLTKSIKTMTEVKKTTYAVLDRLKKHAAHASNHSHSAVKHSVATSHTSNPQKQIVAKKTKKPANKKIGVKKEIADSLLLKQIAIEFYKTQEMHTKKQHDKALTQLNKLKAEVWKSRKIKDINKTLVMSILSSIDITKKKWANKEFSHNLQKVDDKINQLFSKLGFKP